MAPFKTSNFPARKEVQDFLLAAEKLLSPILRDKELTSEECHMICEYLTTMCRGNHPWSGHFTATAAGQGHSSATTQSTQHEENR